MVRARGAVHFAVASSPCSPARRCRSSSALGVQRRTQRPGTATPGALAGSGRSWRGGGGGGQTAASVAPGATGGVGVGGYLNANGGASGSITETVTSQMATGGGSAGSILGPGFPSGSINLTAAGASATGGAGVGGAGGHVRSARSATGGG